MASEPNRVLDAMLALLATPEAWMKYHPAGRRNERGEIDFRTDYPDDERANCFCLVGARRRVVSEADSLIRQQVNRRILAAIQTLFPDRHTPRGRYNLPIFNDHRDTTHADVLSVLRLARAIAP